MPCNPLSQALALLVDVFKNQNSINVIPRIYHIEATRYLTYFCVWILYYTIWIWMHVCFVSHVGRSRSLRMLYPTLLNLCELARVVWPLLLLHKLLSILMSPLSFVSWIWNLAQSYIIGGCNLFSKYISIFQKKKKIDVTKYAIVTCQCTMRLKRSSSRALLVCVLRTYAKRAKVFKPKIQKFGTVRTIQGRDLLLIAGFNEQKNNSDQIYYFMLLASFFNQTTH